MEECYKDYESRETELNNKQQQVTQLERTSDIFSQIFRKDFNQESITFIHNTIEMMKEEIRLNKEQIKQKQEQSNKVNQ